MDSDDTERGEILIYCSGEVARLSQEILPRTLEIPELAKMLGIPRSTAYDLARRDELPVPVLRLGRRLRVSRQAVEELLSRQKALVV